MVAAPELGKRGPEAPARFFRVGKNPLKVEAVYFLSDIGKECKIEHRETSEKY